MNGDSLSAAARERLAALPAGRRAALELLLRRKTGAAAPAPPLVPRPRGGELPLSFDQQRVWLLHQLDPQGTAFNLQLRTICDAPVETLAAALEQLVARHEVLRTTYRMAAREPVQIVHPPAWQPIEVVDLSHVADDALTETALPRIDAEREQAIDLERGPVWRAVAFRLAHGRSALCMTVHHVATDGWSIDCLIAELRELCAASLAGRAPRLPALPIQYADYALWQREWLQGKVLAGHLEYWRERLAGMPQVLDLRPDLPRPPVRGSRGAAIAVTLPAPLVSGLRELAQRRQATLFMTLLALYKCLLARNTGQYDVVVGTPMAGRGRPELEHVQGLFLNSLVLRTRIEGDLSFSEVLARVRDTVTGAFDHQDLPFEKVVTALQPQRDLSRNPLFQALFTQPILDRYVTGVRRAPAGEGPVTLAQGHGEFDIGLWFEDYGGEATLTWHYGADLFLPATIERLARQFLLLARAAVADPALRIERVDLRDEAERAGQHAAWLAAQTPLPQQPLTRDFEHQARRAPAAVALTFEGRALSYAELNARANRLARHLRAAGAAREVRVAVHLERGIDMVVAVLAVLKAGAAYVPMDPGYPAPRLEAMLEDCGAALRLTQERLRTRIKGGAARAICIDSEDTAIAAHDGGDLGDAPALRDLAYIIYTSGSTGRPKGVMVEHLQLANFLHSMAASPGCGEHDVMVAVTTLSFDIAGLELYLPLVTGARIVLASSATVVDGAALARLIDGSGATLVQATPATWRLLLAAGWAGQPRLKLLCGGEALPRELAERLRERCGQLWNLYGPTETTIWSAAGRVQGGGGPVPLGEPIANTRLEVLDPHRRPVPCGVVGELAIGGAGVARGYWQRPELTAERFVPDPSAAEPGARMYLTGDAVRRLADGGLEFVGRNDGQIKLRGHRIELGEIEAALEGHPGVAQAVAALREDRPGDPRLVAYIVPAPGSALTPQELQESAARVLPAHMLPSAWVWLAALPLTPNGKLDRKALPAPQGPAVFDSGPPRSGLEQRVAALWCEVLGIDRLGRRDNFFDLGGHSLGFVQVQAALRSTLGIEVPVVELFEHPTVQALARHLEARGSTAAAAGPQRGRELAMQRRARRGRAAAADEHAVAVIGLHGRFPGARNVDEFWQLLRAGREGISVFDEAELLAAGHDPALVRHPDYVRAKGLAPEVELFDAGFFGYPPADAAAMDPQQRVFLEHAWAALEDAGIDTRRHPGSIGVYAATSLNSYSLQLALAGGDAGQLFLNDKDHLATRVAYKLDLRGPCLTIQTACSSSLVALAEACESLLAHRCDVALAGGVSVGVPLATGHLHQQGGVGSSDGHCRAFDADASGCVAGDGAGVVVLKRLADALTDGDTVHAVVRGVAVNNDGASKAGYTAPSVGGQAEVITTALALADIAADTIGYVEAHGTGTVLGDPIEVAALTQAYRADSTRRQYCAIGSVKTNIGHLDAAAGIAGFIKAVLCLCHRQLPPSLNCQRPNPKIPFAEGPFYVNTELADWPAPGDHPRRAAVSSFGIGGTNAHAVLEEAPPPVARPASGGARLIVLSARSAGALDAASSGLAAHLLAHPGIALADVAYTLQTGRREFEHRRALVCRSPGDAAEALAAGRADSGLAAADGGGVVFMFSGQGAQFPLMAHGLAQSFPSFRADLDDCAERLQVPLGLDLRSVLHPAGGASPEADALLAQTRYAQPALFAVEYALARLWLRWGVEPAAMIGHSVGEWVAACLAGVFTLGDALDLVALRGRLMQAQPPGAMLAVPLPAAAAAAFLDGALCVAADNAPATCVIAGPEDEVAALERRLATAGHVGQRLRTSHAFHSSLMDAVVPALTAAVAAVPRHAPGRPFISNLSGTWITAEQATDPAYWGRHVRATVQFRAGLATLLQQPRRLVEVGPGRTLGTFVRLHPQRPSAQLVLSSLPGPRENRADDETMLQALSQLWLGGQVVDWSALHAPWTGRRIPLPTYPFERERHWLAATVATPQAAAAGPLTRQSETSRWIYQPSWRSGPAPRSPREAGLTGTFVLLAHEGFGDRLAAALAALGARVVRTLDEAAGDSPLRVVHAVALGQGDPGDDAAAGFVSLLQLVQALARRGGPVRLDIVTERALAVTGAEQLRPRAASVLGLARVVQQEHPQIETRTIDIERPQAGGDGLLIDALLGEFNAIEGPPQVAWRHGRRWRPGYEPVPTAAPAAPARVRIGGVYVVTGGLGGVGAALAGHLARTARARLVLAGRTALPPQDEWPAWLAARGDADPSSLQIRRAMALIAEGGEVMTASVDVTDATQLRALAATVASRYGEVHGVIHAAGVLGGRSIAPIEQLTPADCAVQFAVKVDGLVNLQAAFDRPELDFFIAVSSLSTVLGGVGYGAYAAASLTLDALVERAHREGRNHWLALDWDAWRFDGGGATARAGSLAALALTPDEGARVFAQVLSLPPMPQLVISTADLGRRIDLAARGSRPAVPVAAAPAHARPAIATAHRAPGTGSESAIAAAWEAQLGMQGIGVDDDFFDLGGHSLMAIQIVARLRTELGVPLSIERLMELSTVARLAAHVDALRWAARPEPPAAAAAPDAGAPSRAREEYEL